MIAIMLLLAAATSIADPLAPAHDGKQQCYRPDVARRTCHSMSVIHATGPATYAEEETVMVARSPIILFRNTTVVRIVNGAACGQIRSEDLDSGTFTLNGSPLDEERSAVLRTRIKGAMTPLMGKTICQTYEPGGAQLVQHTSLDGVARPDLDEPVTWVSAKDGYSVAP